MQPGPATERPGVSRPTLRFRQPSRSGESPRLMKYLNWECRRSAERIRLLAAGLAISVLPLMLFALGSLAPPIPFAGEWLGYVFNFLGFASLIMLPPVQVVVIYKAGKSMRLWPSDRLAVGVFCVFFAVAPLVTLFVLRARFDL